MKKSTKVAKGRKTETPYSCSACKFRTDLEEPPWEDPRLPVWNPKGKKPHDCWMRCPNDGGPDVALLIHPNRLFMRDRSVFEIGGARVRACTPLMVLQRRKGKISWGPVLTGWALARELFLENYLKTHGKDEHIDLQRLHEAFGLGDPLWVYQVSKSWLMTLRGGRSARPDPWMTKVVELQARNPRAREIFRFEVAAALQPRTKGRRHLWSRVVHVPVDLFGSITEQLEDAVSKLDEMRRYLARFTKTGLPRSRPDTVWRDTYIYMLNESKEMTVREIAREVFSTKDPDAERKVYRIIDKVRRAVAAAHSFPAPSDK